MTGYDYRLPRGPFDPPPPSGGEEGSSITVTGSTGGPVENVSALDFVGAEVGEGDPGQAYIVPRALSAVDGDDTGGVVVTPTSATLEVSGVGGSQKLQLTPDGLEFDSVLSIIMDDLPTANPNVPGQLWMDVAASRVLKVSAG